MDGSTLLHGDPTDLPETAEARCPDRPSLVGSCLRKTAIGRTGADRQRRLRVGDDLLQQSRVVRTHAPATADVGATRRTEQYPEQGAAQLQALSWGVPWDLSSFRSCRRDVGTRYMLHCVSNDTRR